MKLINYAAALAMAATGLASVATSADAQTVVRKTTVVTTQHGDYHRPAYHSGYRHSSYHHGWRNQCRTSWHHHRRVRTCQRIRY